MPWPRSAAVVACVLAATAPAFGARDAAAPEVVVSNPTCSFVPVSFAAFVDGLRVELAGRGQTCRLGDADADADASVDRATAIRVTIAVAPCAPANEIVQIAVADPAEGRALTRELSLADVASAARPRALALAVAELVRSLGDAAPGGPAPPPTLPLPSTGSPSLPPPPSAATVALDAEYRRYIAEATGLGGARLSISGTRARLAGTLDVGGLWTQAHTDLGDVRLRAATAGLSLGRRFEMSHAVVTLAARGELGAAFVTGQSTLPPVHVGEGTNLVAGASVRLSLEAPGRSRVRGRLGLEAGATFHGVTGNVNGAPVVAMQGGYVLVALGLSLSAR